jgi:hypothetical protein
MSVLPAGSLPEKAGTEYLLYFEQSLKDSSRILQRVENFFHLRPEWEQLFNAGKLLGMPV